MVGSIEKTKVDVGLSASASDEIAKHLNGYLANLQVLYVKLHNYHWNIEGEHFYTLHAVLEELYNSVAEEIDEVAERVLKIGHRPIGRVADALEASSITEADNTGIAGAAIAKNLVADYRILIDQLRSLIEVAGKHDDEGSADDAVGYLKDKEKQVWMLTAFGA